MEKLEEKDFKDNLYMLCKSVSFLTIIIKYLP